MAGRKRKGQAPTRTSERDEAIKTTSEYYRLKTKAVEDLVTADESNSPPVSEAELNKYRGRVRKKLPMWLKVSLLKAWFYGSVCFFFLWGLGGYMADALDLFFVTAIALGMVTDLLINTILKHFAETEGANDRWMMVPRRGVAGLFLNILYAFLVLGVVDLFYNVINIAILSLTHAGDTVPLGVEPILFGLLCMAVDAGCIALKRLLLQVVSDAKAKAARQDAPRKGTKK